jgi:hypothetical protein
MLLSSPVVGVLELREEEPREEELRGEEPPEDFARDDFAREELLLDPLLRLLELRLPLPRCAAISISFGR